MIPIYLPFIQINKQYNSHFIYSLNASSVHSNHPLEYAIDFSENEDIRYGSVKDQELPVYWSICFNEPIIINKYTFTEPNYDTGTNRCHQKSWDFYGSYFQNENWTLIDSQRNRSEHNARNYVGTYSVNNQGPFYCFKLEANESYYTSLALTFRRFDIYASTDLLNLCKLLFLRYIPTKTVGPTTFHFIHSLIFISCS